MLDIVLVIVVPFKVIHTSTG